MIKIEKAKKILFDGGAYKAIITLLSLVFFFGGTSCGLSQKKNFSNKARQSEAKLLLSGIHSLENEHYFERKKYTPCLKDFIAQNEKQSHRKYYVGFKPGNCEEDDSVLKANDKISNFDYLPYFEYSNLTDSAFTAIAVGRLCEDCPLDIWSINEKKELVNIQSGLYVDYSWIVTLTAFFLIIVMRIQRKKRKQLNGAPS